MAIESRGFNSGIMIAAADLSAAQFKMVKVTAALTVNLATVKGEGIIGILQNKPKLGEPCDVMHVGISKLVTGAGNLAAAAQYETDTDGTGVTAEVGKVSPGSVLMGASAGELATVTIGLPNMAVNHA